MKRGLFYISLAVLGAAGVGLWVSEGSDDNKEYYTPRGENEYAQNDYRGAADWVAARRVNQITGEINPQDVMNARLAADELVRKKGKSSVLNLQWEELGPENIGGRTRAIMFDNQNPGTLFAGAVSGGLFKSVNKGNSWQRVDGIGDNLAIVSLAQAPDGTIYYGTGEGMYYGATGTGTGGLVGDGIYKSVDGGQTFTKLASTNPSGANWLHVGKLEVDPNNSNRIYAATNNGIRVSDDAGANWFDPFPNGFNSACTDMDISSNGTVWIKIGARIYKSTTGNSGSFNEITSNSTIPASGGRMRIAVSPEDENYVYVVTTQNENFDKAYQSKDGGNTWAVIGQRSDQLNPHAQSQPQGDFNNALAVSPMDKERIFVGGVTFWEWSSAGGWQQRGSLGPDSPGNPFYIHADNHEIEFDPNDPQTVFVGNDGGIFKSSNNGFTWTWSVKNYVTTQFYQVEVDIDGNVMGGTQDNGTILVKPNGGSVLPKYGERVPGVDYNGATRDGDGGFVEFSRLDPKISFKAMQYGIIGRSINNVESYEAFYDNRMDPTTGAGNPGFADFVTPFLLWEKRNDPNSRDSIRFVADSAFVTLGFGNGVTTTFSDTIPKAQLTTKLVPEALIITAGNLMVVSDASGNLSGDGTGTYDIATGYFTVTFSTPPSIEVTAKAGVSYDAGDAIVIDSRVNQLPINDVVPTNMNPGDTVLIQDIVQSMFFVGLTARDVTGASINPNQRGGLWMTRGMLSGITQIPVWYHIGKFPNGTTPVTMAVSDDGDMVYVGTSNGALYRFSNLINARDSADTDVEDFYAAGAIARANTSIIDQRLVQSFGGRSITSIDIHPNDNNKVIVTVGSYGNQNYVFFSNNAASANPSFTSKQGDLPEFPVYASIFNVTDPNGTQVLVGTESGVYTTDDITTGLVSWTQENMGMGNVAVFDLVQNRTVRFDLLENPELYQNLHGEVYAGTHGRGIFRSFGTEGSIGIDENPVVSSANEVKAQLNIYPNPASTLANVELKLENRSDVTISVRDITGKLMRTSNYNNVSADTESLPVNVSGLSSGTYILTLQAGKNVRSAKMIVR